MYQLEFFHNTQPKGGLSDKCLPSHIKCSEVESESALGSIDSAMVSEFSILLPLQSWHRMATASLQNSHQKSGKEEGLVIIRDKNISQKPSDFLASQWSDWTSTHLETSHWQRTEL